MIWIESTDLLVPLVPKNSYVLERVGVAVGLGALVAPFLVNATLKSKRVVYSNFLAVLLYVVVGGVVIGHRYHVGSGGSAVGDPPKLVPRGPINVHLTGGTWEWLSALSRSRTYDVALTLPQISAFLHSPISSSSSLYSYLMLKHSHLARSKTIGNRLAPPPLSTLRIHLIIAPNPLTSNLHLQLPTSSV